MQEAELRAREGEREREQFKAAGKEKRKREIQLSIGKERSQWLVRTQEYGYIDRGKARK